MRVEHKPGTLRVPFEASSVALARHRLADWMGVNGSPVAVIEDARMVVSELVGNAVRHARPLPDGTLLVSWCIDNRGLEVSVTDGGGTTLPRKVNAPSSSLNGRGMAIVDALAQSWWAERVLSRSTVHALLPVS